MMEDDLSAVGLALQRDLNSMPHILSISSRVVRGTVGNTLASFVLQRMGHAVWEVPTVVWDHHPGFGRPAGLTLTGAQIATLLADFRAPALTDQTRLVVSGYFAASDQIEVVRDHILALRAQGNTAPYCCDPVCGDHPGLYVSPAILTGLRTQLLPLATIITPNRHELGFLTNMPVATNDEIAAAARALGRPICLVTSAFGATAARIANLLVTPHKVWICEMPRADAAPNGTGDLMTALFVGLFLKGIVPHLAMGQAAAIVGQILAATQAAGTDELDIVAAQAALVATDLMCPVTRLDVGNRG